MSERKDVVFSKLVTGASLEGSKPLSIPGSALHFLPQFQAGETIGLHPTDTNGARHHLRISKRRNGIDKFGRKLFDKPNIVQTCWPCFARTKGLVPNDRFTLYRNLTNTTSSYQIKVERKLRLFGNDIWVNIDTLPPP